jgi:hypothetical protein
MKTSQNSRDRMSLRMLSVTDILTTVDAELGGVGGLAGIKRDGMLATVD